jgi:ketosteroid isomerase-like protein
LYLKIISLPMNPDKNLIEKWKQEIIDTEKSFAKMAKEKGIHHAFVAFAAEDAVMMRNNNLITGRIKIDKYLEKQSSKGLEWAPEFADVSASGDLGYTYGNYTFSDIDKDGNKTEHKGIFHTVWKRQEDGNWRFVWD